MSAGSRAIGRAFAVNGKTAGGGLRKEKLVHAVPERQSTQMVSQVDALYDVRDRGVWRLLDAQPDLIAAVLDVAQAVPRFFGFDARLALETVTDPEENATEPELYAVISTSMPTKQAIERLNAFDAGWWLERSRRIGPRLTVALD